MGKSLLPSGGRIHLLGSCRQTEMGGKEAPGGSKLVFSGTTIIVTIRPPMDRHTFHLSLVAVLLSCSAALAQVGSGPQTPAAFDGIDAAARIDPATAIPPPPDQPAYQQPCSRALYHRRPVSLFIRSQYPMCQPGQPVYPPPRRICWFLASRYIRRLHLGCRRPARV